MSYPTRRVFLRLIPLAALAVALGAGSAVAKPKPTCALAGSGTGTAKLADYVGDVILNLADYVGDVILNVRGTVTAACPGSPLDGATVGFKQTARLKSLGNRKIGGKTTFGPRLTGGPHPIPVLTGNVRGTAACTTHICTAKLKISATGKRGAQLHGTETLRVDRSTRAVSMSLLTELTIPA